MIIQNTIAITPNIHTRSLINKLDCDSIAFSALAANKIDVTPIAHGNDKEHKIGEKFLLLFFQR